MGTPKEEDKASLSLSLPKSLVKRIRIAAIEADQSPSEWAAKELASALERAEPNAQALDEASTRG